MDINLNQPIPGLIKSVALKQLPSNQLDNANQVINAPGSPGSSSAEHPSGGNCHGIDFTSFNMESFMEAWGTSQENFDYNSDGVVDGLDLGLALGAMAQQHKKSLDQLMAESVDKLMAAWGTDDSTWDINSDGIVDGTDLGLLLGGEQSNPTIDEKDKDVSDMSSPPKKVELEGTSAHADSDPLQQLLQAWGSSDKEFDLNGDGIVDGEDLAQLLAQIGGDPQSDTTDSSQSGKPMAATGSEIPTSTASFTPVDPGATSIAANQIARRIHDQFVSAGFTTQPPANVVELVNVLNLPPSLSSGVMKNLMSMYPGGLGLDATI